MLKVFPKYLIMSSNTHKHPRIVYNLINIILVKYTIPNQVLHNRYIHTCIHDYKLLVSGWGWGDKKSGELCKKGKDPGKID